MRMNSVSKWAIELALLLLSGAVCMGQGNESDSTHQVARVPKGFEAFPYTGEVLPVLYVKDVLKSVVFYVDSLGFVCDHYFNHIDGGSVYGEWPYDEPPVYAEMRAGEQKFALHRASEPDSLNVGGARHYFSVADVETHYKIVKDLGVKVGDLIERPWMHMYRVYDPDGHELLIFTRPESLSRADSLVLTALQYPALKSYLHVMSAGRGTLCIHGLDITGALESAGLAELQLHLSPDENCRNRIEFRSVFVHDDSAEVEFEYGIEGIKGHLFYSRRNHLWQIDSANIVER